jgi:hypothetical protein
VTERERERGGEREREKEGEWDRESDRKREREVEVEMEHSRWWGNVDQLHCCSALSAKLPDFLAFDLVITLY